MAILEYGVYNKNLPVSLIILCCKPDKSVMIQGKTSSSEKKKNLNVDGWRIKAKGEIVWISNCLFFLVTYVFLNSHYHMLCCFRFCQS